MVTTAALPLVLGMAMALLARFALPGSSPALSLIWAALLLFFYWDTLGPPVVPPVAASQKLIYLAVAGILIGLLPERLLSTPGVLVAAALAAALLWLGWRRLAGGSLDPQMIAALVTGLLAIVGVAMLLSLKALPSPPVEDPFLAPAAMLAMCLAGAIISVLGASIVTGQLLGSLAALAGGWCLVQYIAVLRGGTAAAWSKGAELIVVYAAATVLIQMALLAPKANPVALVLSPLPLIVAALVPAPLRRLVPGIRPLRPLVAGLLIAIPAMLAILTAIVRAPHGAALGFS
ncbi:hypothetical protein X730_08645 [Mesorhizobium sp. L103C565B0]|nr:hypothetical protein X730_08645 [Mesorhizobium sp. L103C565B0]